MKKKLKVVIPEGVLKDIPEDEREDLERDLRDLFENAEDGLPGKPVRSLEDGQRSCLVCKGPLENGPSFPFDGKLIQIYECPDCDESYSGPPIN